MGYYDGLAARRRRTAGRNGWLARANFNFEAIGHFMAGTIEKKNAQPDNARATGRRDELIVFAIIAAFIWPVVAVGVVGGFGFLVWMWQLILGPPGPPGA
jgi:periplasmic nitrate reductase NapE